MERRALGPMHRGARLLGVAFLALAPPASAHTLHAAGAPICSWPPCAEDFIEGSFQIGGVPGVDPDYSYFVSSAGSATGHMYLAAGFSWLEATKPSSFEYQSDNIIENVSLQRIGPGPVTVRASLTLAGGATVVGVNTAVKLNGQVSFDGCQIYATKTVTATISTDLDVSGCGAELIGSTIFATVTYDGNLPTNPELYTQLQFDYSSIPMGSIIDLGWEGDLRVELINATATWDTPSFLTQAPEPAGEALGLAAIAALATRGARRRRPAWSR